MMQTVTDRYGRKPLTTEIIPDKLDRYGRAVTPIKAKAVVEPEPVEVEDDLDSDLENKAL